MSRFVGWNQAVFSLIRSSLGENFRETPPLIFMAWRIAWLVHLIYILHAESDTHESFIIGSYSLHYYSELTAITVERKQSSTGWNLRATFKRLNRRQTQTNKQTRRWALCDNALCWSNVGMSRLCSWLEHLVEGKHWKLNTRPGIQLFSFSSLSLDVFPVLSFASGCLHCRQARISDLYWSMRRNEEEVDGRIRAQPQTTARFLSF